MARAFGGLIKKRRHARKDRPTGGIHFGDSQTRGSTQAPAAHLGERQRRKAERSGDPENGGEVAVHEQRDAEPSAEHETDHDEQPLARDVQRQEARDGHARSAGEHTHRHGERGDEAAGEENCRMLMTPQPL